MLKKSAADYFPKIYFALRLGQRQHLTPKSPFPILRNTGDYSRKTLQVAKPSPWRIR